MPDDLARRINRINAPSIDVVFRDDISLTTRDVWREDDLYDSAGGCFRVLDFGVEERIAFQQGVLGDGEEQVWVPSGRVLVEIQRLDPETGLGLSEATFKEIAGEEGAVIAWYGWRLDPRSPRRPEPEAPVEQLAMPGEVCLMCGSSDVVYHDADGTPRCKQHVGESPEADE